MPLTPATRIGPYEIIAPLGAGGMGEVYRARDARLGRDVAIKALPDAFAGDPEHLLRLSRGAQLSDVTRDGQRFLLAVPVEDPDAAQIQVILGWRPPKPR